jgi:molybdopterin-guanine dinucleotide biosynthesis protein A
MGEIAGVILAGGRSRRMGCDKALLMIGGEPVILRIARALSSVFHEVLISAGDSRRYSSLGIPVIADIFKEAGPLSGIHAALSLLGKDIFVVPCDKPLITPELISSVLSLSIPNRITIVTDGFSIHPLLGIYPKVILPDLNRYLEGGGRRVFGFLEDPGIPVSIVDLSGMKDLLKEMNYPEDYISILSAFEGKCGNPEKEGDRDEGRERKTHKP